MRSTTAESTPAPSRAITPLLTLSITSCFSSGVRDAPGEVVVERCRFAASGDARTLEDTAVNRGAKVRTTASREEALRYLGVDETAPRQ